MNRQKYFLFRSLILLMVEQMIREMFTDNKVESSGLVSNSDDCF